LPTYAGSRRAENTTGSNFSAGVGGRGFYGLIGDSSWIGGVGVSGTGTGTSGVNYGVTGDTDSPIGFAGYFGAKVYVAGNLDVDGTYSFSASHRRIDHPLDPANKYLNHDSIESSESLNIYSGNAQLDSRGEAWVTLPDWFDSLNQDMRYHLTSIRAPSPNLYVAEEVHHNRFKIAGGQPGAKVSWQLTGVRHDPYTRQRPLVVEQTKPTMERGTYIFPQGYGQPTHKSPGTAYHPTHNSRRPAIPPSPDKSLTLPEQASWRSSR
jgi:hypothetical protein